MNPQTNPQANPSIDALSASFPNAAEQAAPAAHISEIQRLYWSIRRELWENRSIYIAPLAVAALILVGFFYSILRIPADNVFLTTTVVNNGVVTHTRHGIDPSQVYTVAAALIMGTTFLVAVFYCLDALYSERRDRSILFWKSLPLSDITTVLSKASIPLIILPILTFIIAVVTQTLMLLINLAVFHARGIDTTALHTNLPLAQSALMLLYHLVAIHVLWYAPMYAWLLLVSAWARRTPLLWATLPPVALGVLEVITLHSTHVFELLKYRFHGPQGLDSFSDGASMTISPAHFLSIPGLWTGLALAALFLTAAVYLRRYRNPL